MRDTFDVGEIMLEQVAQSLLEAKKMGRSIENCADALRPLAATDEVAVLLQQAADHGSTVSRLMNDLYQRIAKEASKR